MGNQAILDLLRQLDLKGMMQVWSEYSSPPQTPQQWEDLWLACCKAELAYRYARSFNYRLHLAKLPQMKTLDSMQTQHLPMAPGKLDQLASCDFIGEHENILLIGGSGTGKSHIATALAHLALRKDHRVKFYRCNELARALVLAQTHQCESRLIARLQRFALLVIDELGYVPIDAQAGPLLFELFSGLYEKGSLIITTHLAFDEWGDLFGDKKATKAMIDRLTHHCHLLETGNDSWRLKEGSKDKQ